MRFREILSRRETCRDNGYEMLTRAVRFYDGLHPQSFEAKLLRAFSDTLECLDEMREVLYPLATGQGIEHDQTTEQEC